MQRDRIDLDHQQGYCLSGNHRNCPWLHISLPCEGGKRKVQAAEIAGSLGHGSRTAALAIARVVAAGSRASAAQLWVFLLWARANVPRGIAWSWKEVSPVARAAATTLRRAAISLARGSMKLRPVLRQAGTSRQKADVAPRPAGAPVTAAAASEDFSMLIQLGKEANRAGRRKEANLCFSRAAAADPASEEAWLWMAATSDEPEVAMACLEKALAINPASGKARTQLAGLTPPAPAVKREPEEAVGAGVAAPKLLQLGISALDAGNEDRAYQYFASATKADTSDEAAWFWRAKTSTDLAEVIGCLDRVLEINPRNEKARASLNWALDRQRTDRTRQRFVSNAAPATAAPTFYEEPEPQPQPLLKLASFAYFLLGLTWMAPGLYPLLDGPQASFYRKLAVLPVVRLPYLTPADAGLAELSVPEFNLFYLVPLLVGFLSFIAMESLGNENRAVTFSLVLTSAISIAGAGLFVAALVPATVLIAWSTLAGTSALLGRAVQRRRSRDSAGRSRRSDNRARVEAPVGVSRTARS